MTKTSFASRARDRKFAAQLKRARDDGYVSRYRDGLTAGLVETLHPEQPVTLVSEDVYAAGTFNDVLDKLQESAT